MRTAACSSRRWRCGGAGRGAAAALGPLPASRPPRRPRFGGRCRGRRRRRAGGPRRGRSASATTASGSTAARDEPVRAEVHPARRWRRWRRVAAGRCATTEASTSTSTTISGSGDSTTVTETSSNTETIPSGGGSTTEIDNTTVDQTTVERRPEIRFFAGRVDVTVGRLGKAKQIVEDVRRLDFLPNDKAPWSPSSACARAPSGRCSRSPATSPRRRATVPARRRSRRRASSSPWRSATSGGPKFADGRTYRLRLLATHLVRIPDPRRSGSDGGQNGDPQAGDG